MSITACDSPIVTGGREDQIHMESAFPVLCYHDDLQRTTVPWHWHDELEFLIVTEGSIIATEEQSETVIGRGDGLFVNSGIFHAMRSQGGGKCRLHSIVFSVKLLGSTEQVYFGKYLSRILGNGSIRSLILHRETDWQRGMLRKIEEAWEMCRDEPEGYEWQVRNALSEAVLLLWQNIPGSPKEDRACDTRRQRMKLMLRYLHENYMHQVTLADLSAAASVSESEVMRCFSTVLKTSPIRFLRDYRIEKSAELLNNSSESVGAIAEQCGFRDEGYYIRCFRKKYRCTPGQFRKAKWEPVSSEK